MGGEHDGKEGYLNYHIRSLGFQDIREGVTLQKVILWRLGYNVIPT